MNNYFELSDEQKRFVLHNAEERIQEMIHEKIVQAHDKNSTSRIQEMIQDDKGDTR